MYRYILLATISTLIAFEAISQQYGSFKDSRDGKTYKTILIGNQTWMAQNLNVDRFRNGDPILHAKTNDEWERAGKNKQPAWCYYNNDPENGRKYGKLYNWYAVNDPRGLAPKGWHIPTDKEWSKLIRYLGKDAATKIKNTFDWMSLVHAGDWAKECPKCIDWSEEVKNKTTCSTCKGTRRVTSNSAISKTDKMTNNSGFSGLPGGMRGYLNSFSSIKSVAYWWCSTLLSANNIFARSILLHINNSYHPAISERADFKKSGFAVRCVK